MTSSRRPSMSSVSLASAEVVMPCGHHRSVASSSSFHRKPWSTARTAGRAPSRPAGSGGRARPDTPTRRPKRSTAASMSATFSSVRRRWMLDDGSGAHRPNVDGGTPLYDCAACVRWSVSRSSSTAACSRPVARTRPRSPGSGSCPAARSSRGRSSEAAAVREIAEELGCRRGRHRALDGHLARSTTTSRSGSSPRGWSAATRSRGEHDAVRWLRADELDEVTWAEADVPFLDPLRDRDAEHD